MAAIFRRIHRDEAGHVRLSRRIAAELASWDVIAVVAERTRLGLVGVLAQRGEAFERLQIDAGQLFMRLGHLPDGLFP